MPEREQLQRIGRLQRLAVFESAARLGSFSAAAADLGMTQPAVTRQIRLLERSLGVDLFVRSANSSTLSDSGVRLRDHVSAGLDVLEAGLTELSESAGTVVLAVTAGIAQQILIPRLDGLTGILGDLELRLMIVDREKELTEGGFDAAIWVGDGRSPGFSARRLFDEVVFPVASPTLADANGLTADSTAADVHRAPLIHMDDGDRPWMTWAQWLANFGITLRRQPARVLLDNYPLVLHQALAGKGVALGWRGVVDALVAGQGLVVVGPEVRSERGYHLLWPEGRPSSPVEAILAWLDDEFPTA
jgi:DNA-binding transcriptional LysR family regulator